MKTKLTAIALTLGVLAGGAVTPASAADRAPAGSVAEETRRDLEAWRAAGFDEASYTSLSVDPFSDEYRARMARYQELRQQQPNAN